MHQYGRFLGHISFIVFIVIKIALAPVSTSILITTSAIETFTVIGGHLVLQVFTVESLDPFFWLYLHISLICPIFEHLKHSAPLQEHCSCL